MSDISGPGGNFTAMSGFAAHYAGWAATVNVTNVENTGFAENGNRTYLPTAQNVTGSAVGTGVSGGNVPSGITGPTPTFAAYQGTVTLQAASGSTMSFFANVTAIGLNRPNDGKMDYAFNFISSGPISGTI